jgi:hypothetical protein
MLIRGFQTIRGSFCSVWIFSALRVRIGAHGPEAPASTSFDILLTEGLDQSGLSAGRFSFLDVTWRRNSGSAQVAELFITGLPFAMMLID